MLMFTWLVMVLHHILPRYWVFGWLCLAYRDLFTHDLVYYLCILHCHVEGIRCYDLGMPLLLVILFQVK